MTIALADRDRVGTRHVEACMGTVFTIDIRDLGRWDDAVADVVAWLHRVDATFSTYRPESDVSRIRAGELDLLDAAPDVIDVMDLCSQVESETGGAFTAFWDGGLDPTGLVKGWAIERASQLLRTHGSDNHAVNGGGDIQLAGEAGADEPWRIGIVHPLDRAATIATVAGRDLAVATSGTAERGHHIIDPTTCGPAGELSSVTVIGPSLTRVDAYATAAFVMGADAKPWLERLPNHHGILVHTDGRVLTTSGRD
jgi:thiamine biosynthesis lipoprotein